MKKNDLREAIKHFLRFVPEGVFPSDYQDITHMYEEGDNGAAFMSETFLYNAIGKEDARSVLARFDQICRTAGFNLYELEMEIAAEYDKDE